MKRAPGEFALVLHTHLPYVAHHGVWPVGEEWLFQAWGTSWLPVTDLLCRLGEDGHRDVLTLSVSPTVAHQVADPRLGRDLGTWLASQLWLAEEQRTRYDGPDRAAIRDLAPWHWQRYAALLDLHARVERDGGLLAVWAELASAGVIEVLAGPSTHPYLPLADDPTLIDAQLATGVAATTAWTGRRQTGFWAPECAYRPAGPVGDPTQPPPTIDPDGTPTLARSEHELPGLETFYERHGLTHVLVDAATLVRAAGGAGRDWTIRPAVPDVARSDPYEVVHDAVWIGDSSVAAFGRDLAVAYHVWSPAEGYPGDPWYRDFHALGGFGVHPSWRVTDKGAAPHEKAVYEPGRADARTAAHAAHLHGVLRDVLDPRSGQLVVAAYDTELFGHWWTEGPTWLERLLRRVGDDPALRMTTLASRLERRPPTRRLDLPESSWGYAKGHASWVTPETREMWSELRRVEARFAEATGEPATSSVVAEAQRQAARELAVAQASDWPFLVNRGGCADYAWERFRGHVANVDTLLDLITGGADEVKLAEVTARLHARTETPHDPSPFLVRRRS